MTRSTNLKNIEEIYPTFACIDNHNYIRYSLQYIDADWLIADYCKPTYSPFEDYSLKVIYFKDEDKYKNCNSLEVNLKEIGCFDFLNTYKSYSCHGISNDIVERAISYAKYGNPKVEVLYDYDGKTTNISFGIINKFINWDF